MISGIYITYNNVNQTIISICYVFFQGRLFNVLAEHPDKAHEIIESFFSALEKARPNPAHLALAKLEEMGHLAAVITQNVDNLHREAGSRSVCELHGNLYRLRCMTCGRKQGLPREALFEMVRPVLNKIDAFSLDALLQAFPKCECGGGAYTAGLRQFWGGRSGFSRGEKRSPNLRCHVSDRNLRPGLPCSRSA